MSLKQYRTYVTDLKNGSSNVEQGIRTKIAAWKDLSPDGIKKLKSKILEDLLFFLGPGCGAPGKIIAAHIAKREDLLGPLPSEHPVIKQRDWIIQREEEKKRRRETALSKNTTNEPRAKVDLSLEGEVSTGAE